MNFNEQLNKFISELNCSSKDLANISGLSPTVISRYRNGERTPNIRSKQLNLLVEGLYKLFCEKKIPIEKEEIYKRLSTTLNDVHIDLEQLVKNFNELVSVLDLNISSLSRKTGFDSSYISKIRNGSIFPSKPQLFIDNICEYIVNKYNTTNDLKSIASLIDCKVEDILDVPSYYKKLQNWLSSNVTSNTSYINNFLKNLDEFNLEQYIKAIHFDEMKVPFVPFYKSGSKSYYGIEEMKKGEIDFFKATVLSKSADSVFMCSDMPMEDMAKDLNFGKKWMYAIAIMLKKGLHLDIIHNVDRPFNEMMLGLENWIPIYMTGQVSPYYLKDYNDKFYKHLNYVSGTAALCGECIGNYHNDGKYYLTSSKHELSYYKKKAELLLRKSTPLMQIYKKSNQGSFNSFIESNLKVNKNYRRVLSSLPIHTISNELLLRILKRNKIPEDEIKNIQNSVEKQRQLISNFLVSNTIQDETFSISKDEFENAPLSLSLSICFCESKVYYTYDEYLEHLELTKKYEHENSNYTFSNTSNNAFRNIQISICEKKWVMISKDNSPSIHFVINHPKLREAIENFIPPIVEK